MIVLSMYCLIDVRNKKVLLSILVEIITIFVVVKTEADDMLLSRF